MQSAPADRSGSEARKSPAGVSRGAQFLNGSERLSSLAASLELRAMQKHPAMHKVQ
jgi:hypothetical protein